MLQEVLEQRFAAGKANAADLAELSYARWDALIALERFGAKLGKKDMPVGDVTKSLFEGIEIQPQP